jgi:hypothetical protein
MFGLTWLFGIGSILAVMFGHSALKQIRRSSGRMAGHGMAVVGIVLGYVGIVATFAAVLIAVFVPGAATTSAVEAQELDTTTTSVATTSTTTTVPPTTSTTLSPSTTTTTSAYVLPTPDEIAAWSRDAMDFVRTSTAWQWDDPAGAAEWSKMLAKLTCLRLYGAGPIVAEAEFRERTGMEGWSYYGEVWWDSLANGLCIRH